jgi:hypothetical protein
MSLLNITCIFCRVEVTIIHSLQNFATTAEKFRNVAAISQYYKRLDRGAIDPNNPDLVIQSQFDNTQLFFELKIIDSTEDDSDKFTFKLYNVPEGTIFVEGDYLLFKIYWDSDPTTYTTYHGIIKSVKSKRTVADLQATIKGSLVDQDILNNWSIYQKYPKLTYYSDVKDFIEQELKFNFTPLTTNFLGKVPLSKPILTYNKSIGDILGEVCKQLSASGQECSWKFVNNNTILIYKKSDLGTKYLNEVYNLRVPTINYNDIFEFTSNGTGFIIETEGIPTLTAGIVFCVEVTSVPSYITAETTYYIVNEVEHNITLKDGYLMKIYCDLANPGEADVNTKV